MLVESLYRAPEQNIFDQVAKDRMWARGLCGHCTDADLTMGIPRVSIPADIATCVYLRVYARQDFTRLHVSRHLQRVFTHRDAVRKADSIANETELAYVPSRYTAEEVSKPIAMKLRD